MIAPPPDKYVDSKAYSLQCSNAHLRRLAEAANTLTDPALRSQAQALVNTNRNLFTKFYNLV